MSGKLREVGRRSGNVTTRRGEANHGPAEAPLAARQAEGSRARLVVRCILVALFSATTLGMARGGTGRPDNRPVNLGMVRQAHADTKISSDFLPRRCSLNK